jgi:uncharacterized membrane protein YeaQ/YmgE (transglycosylase-associated protein family)
MLHLIWYIFVGFLVGCVAKALMHTHLSITWTVVLGIVGSIIGGAVTSVLSAWRRRQISSRGSNCFNRWGDFGFVHLAQVQTSMPRG